jgi:hypothetical protein
MAQQKLRMMISSRSDRFSIPDGRGGMIALREARLQLKQDLEGEGFLGEGLLDVWINEAEDGDHDATAWDECIANAEACDLFISLYDGSAGWAPAGGAVGICQAEFDAALRLAPGKVKVVRLPGNKLDAKNPRDVRFLDALTKASRFEIQVKKDWPELRERMHLLARQMVLRAAQEGAREYRKSGANVGQALDWSRMTFAERSVAIANAIAGALEARKGLILSGDIARVVVQVDGQDTLICCHGAPRSLSVAAAREFVGQPFLRDHRLVDGVAANIAGPVHFIGCPRSATESQAVNLLGFPDFTVVEGSFGVYAADKTQKIQLCLLADCVDPGSTRNAVTRFFEWLERSGEQRLLLQRAASRRRIIDTILAEA